MSLIKFIHDQAIPALNLYIGACVPIVAGAAPITVLEGHFAAVLIQWASDIEEVRSVRASSVSTHSQSSSRPLSSLGATNGSGPLTSVVPTPLMSRFASQENLNSEGAGIAATAAAPSSAPIDIPGSAMMASAAAAASAISNVRAPLLLSQGSSPHMAMAMPSPPAEFGPAEKKKLTLTDFFAYDYKVFAAQLRKVSYMDMCWQKALVVARLLARLEIHMAQSLREAGEGKAYEEALSQKIQQEFDDARRADNDIRSTNAKGSNKPGRLEATLAYLAHFAKQVYDFCASFDAEISEHDAVKSILRRKSSANWGGLLLQNKPLIGEPQRQPGKFAEDVFCLVQKHMLGYIMLSFSRDNRPACLSGTTEVVASSVKSGMSALISLVSPSKNPLGIAIGKRDFALNVMERIWCIPLIDLRDPGDPNERAGQRDAYVVALYEVLKNIFIEVKTLRAEDGLLTSIARSASEKVGYGSGEALEEALKTFLHDISALPDFKVTDRNSWDQLPDSVAPIGTLKKRP